MKTITQNPKGWIALICLLFTANFGIAQTCSTTINSFPYSQDFEVNANGWTQGTADNFNWTRDSGGTPSSGTGPTTGNGDTFYMYIEVSGGNNPNQSADFLSPCFDLTSFTSASFSYSYHMYGANVGSLTVDLSTDNGTSYPTNLRSFSGNLGNTWNTDTIDLTPYVGQSIMIRFRGTSSSGGSAWSGDIAIDNVSVAASAATGPEINITGNGSSIADGDTTPSVTDFTDFGNVQTISSQANTFIIQSIGTTTVNLTDASPYINISGANAADFSVTSIPSNAIANGSSTTFEITFTPSALGLRTASISIANNDTDENPYNFDIQGTGVVPSYCTAASANDTFEWIGNVTLGAINNSSAGGTTATGYSDFTGISTNLTQGLSYPVSITPVWASTVYDEAFAVYIDFNQDYDFDDPGELVFTAGPDQVTPQTGNISIPMTATIGSTRMRVIMDDVNPVAGPCVNPNFGEVEDYTVNILAGSPNAEINVTGNGNSITDGDITPSFTDGTDFGGVALTGGTNANSFIIENLGGVNDLNLTGPSPYVSIGGLHAADFSVTTIPSNVIGAGSSTTFVITFDPSAIGPRTATVSIANDDSDENPYTFSIQGTGFIPPPCGNTITYTADFETGNDGWVLSGSDATRLNNAARAYENNYSIRLRNTGAMTLSNLDFTGYEKVEVEFFFYSEGMELNESFVVEYRENTLAAWQQVELYNSNGNAYSSNDGDFINNNFHARIAILYDSEFTFVAGPTAEIRITNQGSDTTDMIYVDKMTISGTTYCVPTLAPGGINTGLTLWLKADEVTGSTVQADNSDVDAWIDNGQGHNAKVSDPASVVIGKPVFKNNPTDNVNFNPVLAFGNDPFTAPKSFTYLEANREVLHGTGGFNTEELYVVVVPDITVNSSLFPPMDLLCAQNDSTNVWDEDVTGYGFGDYSARFTNEMVAYANGTNPTPTPGDVNLRGYGIAETGATVYDSNSVLVLSARNTIAGTSQELYMNGNNIGITEVGVPQFFNSENRRFWIGRSQAFGGSFNGRIAEVISYNTRVDDVSERPKIESYLAVKYGITQGVNGVSQDYVDSDGTVIWNQAANAGYNYDIAGIGRDDASTLDQKQSSSINYEIDGGGRTRGILTIGLTDIYDTNYDNKTSNPTTLNDKEYLMWGNNGVDLNLAASVISVDMSAGIGGLSTPVTFTGMQRVWKVVENGGDIPTVKVSIPQNAIRNISPPGSYLMFISDTGIFDPTADYRIMTPDGSGNLETTYDFDNTKYVTFGYAPQVIVERSVYFDGVVDYIDMEDNLEVDPTGFTLSAWVKRDAADSGTKSIISKRDAAFTEGYDFQILNDNRIRIFWKNGSDQILTSNTALPDDQWHHVAAIYDGAIVSLYIDGVRDISAARSAPVATTASFYIAAAGKNTPVQHFRGNLDEVRVWNTALTEDQLRFVMNQEIADNAGQVMGNELPTTISRNDINAVPWSDLAGYYPMSIYTYTNTDDASGNGNQGALRNLDTVDRQTAPLPYESTQNGDWDINNTWLNGNVQYIPGSPSIVDPNITVDWNIVRTSHNITMDNSSLPAVNLDNRRVLGLEVAANELTLPGDNATHTGNAVTVTHYMRLTGKIDLEGESQLIQELNSDLLVDATGELEKDQQGTADTFTYNYWAAPVGDTDMSVNNFRYTVEDIMYDGTNPVNFSSAGFDGAASSPVTIADYWIWKFANLTSGSYSAWQHVRRTGTLLAGEGFTMKGPGTGTILTDQNYVFLGKPNNGDVNLTINAGNDYLVGNPYASAIDANQFILDNGPELLYDDAPDTTPLLSGTLYFWEHWGGGSHILAEYQGGYATYNFSGAVAAASLGTNHPDVATGGTPTKLPGRYIPVGQGFFVTGENTGTINFNNGQRVFVKEGTPSSVFTRSASASQNSTNPYEADDRMKLRIGFNSVNTIYRQLLLTIDEKATTGVDWAYDGKLNETQIDDMFWMIQDGEYVIQGSNELREDSVYPLGVRIDSDGNNRISIDQLENVPSDVDIYLHDKALSYYHDLRAGDYTIFLNAGAYLDRFEITFRNESEALSVDEETFEQLDILYSNDIKKLVLINPISIPVESIELFNVMGQSVLNIENISESGYSEYDVKNLSTGTYIVKLYTVSGSVSTKKVLVN